MKNHFTLSLFVFRRDLRVVDNTALNAALSVSEKVIVCFIFDDRQLKNNPYFGEKSFSFLLESLQDLKNAIEEKGGALYFFQGIAETVIEKLCCDLPIEAIFFNRDYTPFSRSRDVAIRKNCQLKKISCFISDDALLQPPEIVLKKDGTPYTVFTPFYRFAKTISVNAPQRMFHGHFYNGIIISAENKLLDFFQQKSSEKSIFSGGRSEGVKLLLAVKKCNAYAITRDFPEKNGTSHLSAHHKFGTVSIRESFYATVDETFRKELYWRDFFSHIAYHFPHVFQGAFHKKYNKLAWNNNEKDFQKWCIGKTGFPIVDAGMRELNETGYMHNRVRMIAASFLVKDLLIDWRWGEQYFAQKLVDYDPAVNNGNWQWAASTGCDAQPYFRVFNPDLQQKRFDPAFHYIQRWVPEVDTKNYPKPMVDHKLAAAAVKALFK